MAKEETKEQAKEEAKEQTKEEAKEQTKEEVKEQTKEEVKEQVKEEAKEVKETKKEEKPQTKDKKKWSTEIKKLGDAIVNLTLMQAKELGDYLEQEYGIEPAAGGAVMMAGPVSAAAEEVKEKTSFDVILKSFGDKKIQVIKEVRALTGLGLKEAKDLVDGVPKPVKQGLNKQEAEAAQKQLEAVGAAVELA